MKDHLPFVNCSPTHLFHVPYNCTGKCIQMVQGWQDLLQILSVNNLILLLSWEGKKPYIRQRLRAYSLRFSL